MAARNWDPRAPYINVQFGSCAPRILYDLYEGDSQTFKAGSLVKLSGGDVVAATAGDTQLAGIALKAGTNVTSSHTEIPIMPITPTDDVLIQVSSGGTLEASNTTCAPGTGYDIVLDSTSSFWTLDSADVTNPLFMFVEPVKDVNGDATYWAHVKLLGIESDFEHVASG